MKRGGTNITVKLTITLSDEEAKATPDKYGKAFTAYTNEELVQLLKMGRYQIAYRTQRNRDQWALRKEQQEFWKKHHPKG